MKGDQPYSYTEDWFTKNISVLRRTLNPFAGRSDLAVLEIGSWEGRSAVWLVSELFTGADCTLHCIDAWAGPDGEKAEARFDQNMRHLRKAHGFSLQKHKALSSHALKSLAEASFDIAYVDGSHLAHDVLTDLVLTWPLLKPNGVMICDDYGLKDEMQWHDGFSDYPVRPIPKGPKSAIDSFIDCFEDQFEILHADWQVILQKR